MPRPMTTDREYCPDCGLEITEDYPIAEEAIEEGDDLVCEECWDRRQREREGSAVEAEVYRKEREIEDGADTRQYR